MAPTVFIDVRPEMRIAQEEFFGPVVVVMPFETTEEAIAIANGTDYGLAAGLYTRDLGVAHTRGAPAGRRPSLCQPMVGRRGGDAFRRNEALGLWPREGTGGAAWLHADEEHRHPPLRLAAGPGSCKCRIVQSETEFFSCLPNG